MMPVPIQIPRSLMQPEVWRLVGFASTILGLVCYALSSSFNYLFGKWNLLKLFLYTFFSFVICFLVLFAKIWRHTTSPRFKAHSAVFALTLTSVYSFYFDKVVNGKPDAYSLISCASFAIMSVSLSRQTQCGFEVDFLYFFLGCLIVQLMKIKLSLAVVGIGFSYLLVILRSSLDGISRDEYFRLQDENHVIVDVDIVLLTQRFMSCIKALKQDMLFKHVKDYLEDDFELKVNGHNFAISALPSAAINDLHETAKLMVGQGFEKECCDVYSRCRRENLEEFLMNKLFGLQNITIEEEREKMGIVQFEEYMIRRWVQALKVSLRILFPIEQQLCNRVFSGFSSAVDLCFAEICHESAIQLLKFADAVASGSPSIWRLFKVLDMFEVLCELIPGFQSLFSEMLVNEAIKTQNRLGEASRDIFLELGNLIFRVPKAKEVAPSNCELHPTTHYVMGYLVSACQSQKILERILQEYPMVVNGVKIPSSLSAQVNRIMQLLERKLIAKSKNYKDHATRYFFMMNNWRHIEQEAKVSGLDLDCFRKSTEKVKQTLELYEKSSWNKVSDSLKLDNNVATATMKDKLRLFNLQFEEIRNVQSRWIVLDKQLREQIIISLENSILPAYGNFIGRFHEVLGPDAYEYIKFGMFDIQDQLNHLFLGKLQQSPELKEKEKLLKQKHM